MNDRNPPNRCRLVLIAPEGAEPEDFARQLADALSGGDVASLILPQYSMGEEAFQTLAERVAPLAQERGVAVIVAGDSRVAGRVRCDGIHLEAGKSALAEAVEKANGRIMVGAGGVKTRDEALELGETRPDYLFFGRFGYDRTPEPHPRNLALGRWWAEMIEIPCIVLGGSDLASVETVGATGAEFVALTSAIFAADLAPGHAVSRVNDILDRSAPQFDD